MKGGYKNAGEVSEIIIFMKGKSKLCWRPGISPCVLSPGFPKLFVPVASQIDHVAPYLHEQAFPT